MNLTQWRALLGRAVRNRVLTPAEAARIARELPPTRNLPAPTGVLPLDRAMVNRALGGQWAGLSTTARRQTSIIERGRFRDRIQADFDKQARNLAASLASGKLTPAQWQIRMRDAVTNLHIRQHIVGRGGGVPTGAALAELDQRLRVQQQFLARFAESHVARALAGRPYTEGQLQTRAALYGGSGQAEWWRAAVGANGVRYVARDDGGTCGPCLRAEGEYPPGAKHPYPGEVCLGRHLCRCSLEILG